MNEEEKQAIEILDYELTYSWVHNQGISKEALKLFKDIIEKIEKQQKEIKKYSEIFKNTEETTLYADGQPIQKIIELTNYISKDKIKEKIKELEGHIWKDGYMTKFDKYAIHYLKELLGE